MVLVSFKILKIPVEISTHILATAYIQVYLEPKFTAIRSLKRRKIRTMSPSLAPHFLCSHCQHYFDRTYNMHVEVGLTSLVILIDTLDTHLSGEKLSRSSLLLGAW